jgi:hypothetical protein
MNWTMGDETTWTMRRDSTPLFTKPSSRQYSGISKNKEDSTPVFTKQVDSSIESIEELANSRYLRKWTQAFKNWTIFSKISKIRLEHFCSRRPWRLWR